MKINQETEGSFAEAWQVIVGIKFDSFLTPGMASKNDVSYTVSGNTSIDLFEPCPASFFDAISGVKS